MASFVREYRISDSWTLEEEGHEDYNVRMGVIDRMSKLKNVPIQNNPFLVETLKHIYFMYHDPRYPNPRFQIGDKWYVLNRANMSDYPKKVRLFQMEVTPPDQAGKCYKKNTRIVEIVYGVN
jgi:hypothetical protein